MDNNTQFDASVLLVDDETALIAVMMTTLQDAGYKCLCASSSPKAFELLEENKSINVIISDIRMPGEDGLQMLQRIRSHFVARGWLQTLFITGHPTMDNAVTAMRLEAVDFLSKPVHRIDLIAAVEKAQLRASKYRAMISAIERNKQQLEHLVRESDIIASLILKESVPRSSPQMTVNTCPKDGNQKAAKKVPCPTISKTRILELLRFRELRPRLFKERLFSDPAWQMLLDLMENNLLEKEVSVSSLYIASGVPISTASRRLDDLEEVGLVTRWDDPNDGRRQYVRVTEKAEKLITNYLADLDRLLSSTKV